MKFKRKKTDFVYDFSVAGIDPGFTGAISIIDKRTQKIIEIIDMPVAKVDSKPYLDGQNIKTILKQYNIKKCYIEEGQTMPKQGVTSAFRYGKGCGVLEGICIGCSIPYELIKPTIWKKAMMNGVKKGKGDSIIKVKQLYPNIRLPRKKDHGKADAILICLYGIRWGI